MDSTLRLTRCQIEGRLPQLAVELDPWPRAASTAQPAAPRTFHALVTVLGSQPAASATRTRVTAALRPVPWSANCAQALATAASVELVIETFVEAHTASSSLLCAHASTPPIQPARDVHIGVDGAVSPARCTQFRRCSRFLMRRNRCWTAVDWQCSA
ncbi:hypothetical protein H7I87_11095 [Mycobacterium timonense]|uniref:Uncharacterized protein n=2 Tax=Mycobacterium avium complex (MAC) TaxID=120793 RepID=A0AAW5SC69_MYCBC|nr:MULTISPECIES: hypothetical protein [Mycobacterium avium complex (MAC)]MCV6993128.1 hypothetical protein [Mycobacterium bouchedurhonense]MCV6995261.1 hypothetical protein [Mycobacterium timonense]MDV3307114.1 hypothetical protein [Mycobacterium avium subsp. hominissuis]